MPKENRGGDHRSTHYEEKRESVKTFIKSLKGEESHYYRNKTANRVYLSSELNIRKLCRMYNAANPERSVKQSFFRNIFNKKFIIGFGNPRTDVCTKCLEWSKIMIEKTIHKKKSEAFYEILREEQDQLMTFYCLKNMSLPAMEFL